MGFLSGLFGSGGNESSSNSTTSANTSNTTSIVDSHNLATNTSVNSTSNNTSTLTQDRRLVVDSGSMGISADNSTISTANSNNSTTNNYTTTTDYGSVAASIAANKDIAGKAIDVSQAVVSTGRDMMQANIDFLQHVSDGTQAEARAAISEVAAATGNAINQVVGIAAKPLNAQDPQHILVIVGLVVVGAVIFTRK